MAVTIANSVGYEGTIQEPDWARLMIHAAGRRYGVVAPSDWKVTPGAADREIRIAPGMGFAAGVLDRTDAEVSLTLPARASGSRWHLIVARRDWQANVSSFDSIPGPTGSASIPTREVEPGILDEQPLALVRVQAGQSQVVEIRDLRVWVSNGGAFAVDDLVRQYLGPLGTSLFINGVAWNRALNTLGTSVWVRTPSEKQAGTASGTQTGGIAYPGATTHLAAFTVPNAIPAGSMLHVRGDVEIYVPTAGNEFNFAGFLQVRRGDDVLVQRRWHSNGRNGRWIYAGVELNVPVVDEIAANTAFRFSTTSDPLSAAGVEVWMANVAWSVS